MILVLNEYIKHSIFSVYLHLDDTTDNSDMIPFDQHQISIRLSHKPSDAITDPPLFSSVGTTHKSFSIYPDFLIKFTLITN